MTQIMSTPLDPGAAAAITRWLDDEATDLELRAYIQFRTGLPLPPEAVTKFEKIERLGRRGVMVKALRQPRFRSQLQPGFVEYIVMEPRTKS